ncbi:hypothetical protein [Kingella oralis]
MGTACAAKLHTLRLKFNLSSKNRLAQAKRFCFFRLPFGIALFRQPEND